ncbi:UvrD-helicase domain-containing protein [Kribbella sp. NPDC059898]|uniref:UvrD-helicase domain-containing protein n=1 Tax=Kribbella sp. NPDC059898 TaxID=3346995 RepID=UPI003653A883
MTSSHVTISGVSSPTGSRPHHRDPDPAQRRSEMAPSFRPTAEQAAAVDAFRTGTDMVLEAGAGTGKTSTLKLMAAARPRTRGIYVAYNKSIAKDAQASFPGDVECRTAHGFAYIWMGRRREWGWDALNKRVNGKRVLAPQTARILGAKAPLRLGPDRMITSYQLARIAMETTDRFCLSADREIQPRHVPRVNGAVDDADRAALVKAVLPFARKAWEEDLTRPDGELRFNHDVYLKMWALTNPILNADYVLLDEAQDSTPVVTQLFNQQRDTQKVAVGDSCQAIYGWRGAQDAMAGMVVDHRMFLQQSFRFGPAIAEEANKWLELLNADLRLIGTSTIASKLKPLAQPNAVLCRSNAEAVDRLMRFHRANIPAAIVGGGNDVRRLAEAAVELREKGRTAHPELCVFTSWGMVQEYVEHDHGGRDLSVAVRLIDDHGPEKIIEAIDRSVSESKATIVLSTAHKAKGREWNSVEIADDFRQPSPDEEGRQVEPAREESMLAYVAVTRAQRYLDRSGLEWIDEYVSSPGSGGSRLGRLAKSMARRSR